MLRRGVQEATLVSFVDTSVLLRIFALRIGYQVDQNQEIIALGTANIAAGFFQGFSVNSSSSHTPIAESAVARTQLTGVVGAACIAVVLALLGFIWNPWRPYDAVLGRSAFLR